jgi:hypothetical protein
MVKESILFVAGTSLLVFLIMPAQQPAEVTPVPEETAAPVVQTQKPSNTGWDYEESDGEEEPFIFGEPVKATDSDYETTGSSSEESISSRPTEESASSSPRAESTSPEPRAKSTADSPANTRPKIPAVKIYD